MGTRERDFLVLEDLNAVTIARTWREFLVIRDEPGQIINTHR